MDPFSGTGTTPLVAAQLGHRGLWAEVNPYLREAAETKLAAACAQPSHRRAAVHDLQQAVASGPTTNPPDNHPVLEANSRREFFAPGIAEELVQWVRRFEDLENRLARRVGRLAVASSAISVSNMKRAVDLRRRTSSELQQVRPLGSRTVCARVADFCADLEATPKAPGSARYVSSDARKLPMDLEPVDIVVTSPPYLNGTNYFRNTKLELLLLEIISDETELGSLRTKAVTAGINNVSRRIPEPETLDWVEPIARRLDEVAYDARIPKMVRAYFADMKTVLATTRHALRVGGRLVLDIGDSRFAGVHVDTPTILTRIAESVGWKFEHSAVLRSRVAKDGNPLCQKLLYLSR